ncbi:tetraacyldisaccharide 4'-kinase [Zhouia spongiae]|uniref:Tetraacyldisaccharide 4'-kinase n=1 Tax=Zhouia spongiae TaxID=2202721 RepID=A0ABY3YMI2_9FLAO|nr:tetraacyldisaccharide 4'-kinase [Zhouia spongiae]UNY99007.1 tetraacyldisaccharide 4'-kinase [Zhouia spongiae]
MRQFRKILLPFSCLYGSVIRLRHLLYDKGIIKTKSYDFPVICVGNLSVGGTGKTPMTEYLIHLLKNDFKVAILSRGYKRKSHGFVLADQSSTVETLGDEPMQYHNKFKDIYVAVDADRQHGIEILRDSLRPGVVVLDDAYQHRKVKAGFNILLTSYSDLYVDDLLLPAGNLRDIKSRAKYADVIVVTKCPEAMDLIQKNNLLKRIKPRKHQEVYFSKISYGGEIISSEEVQPLSYLRGRHFTLVTGIAKPDPLVNFLKSKGLQFEHLDYPDHHDFSSQQVGILRSKGIVLTTEKDYMRLKYKVDDVYYLPINNEILFGERKNFDNQVIGYMKKA